MSLLIYKVSKRIKEQSILDRISFYLPKGCLGILVGPSGSGKSTLLRVIAGLEEEGMIGSIWLNGRDYTHTPMQYRKMGFVFQTFALFQHMNVTENISFGLKLRFLTQDDIRYRVNFLLDALRIKDIALQYPDQLSGGQKQRVALARTLAIEPQFLLLDEPFKALDTELRTYLGRWLKKYLKEHNITALMVTHDQTEALALADEILVLHQGHLIQQAKSSILYDNPINPFVGEFLGPLLKVETCSDFLFRPYEFSLGSKKKYQAACLVELQSILYRRHWIELELSIISNAKCLRLQLGYPAFDKASIQNLKQLLYLSLRNPVQTEKLTL